MMQDNFNDFDHVVNLFNGIHIGNIVKESKEYFKGNKDKDKYFILVRNQYNFNSLINSSFIKNKQAYISIYRERFNKMNAKDFEQLIRSDNLLNEYVENVPDVILDVQGVAAVFRKDINNILLHMNYNFFVYPELLEFINEDLKELLKGTEIPYNERFFKVGVNNTRNFFSSILAAYIKTYPDTYPDLFKQVGYNAILEIFPMVLNTYKRKIEELGDDETIVNYINYFFRNYCNFNQDISNYCAPYMTEIDNP